MAFVGNLRGPRESHIVARLGASYFGISEEQLQSEIDWYEDEEMRQEITPVRRDSGGRYYIVFTAPNRQTQHFYLDEHGYLIPGEARIWDPDDPAVELSRGS